jgi:dihydrofolate reductase
MKLSVFIGTSLDGFIARPDGSFDFLPEGGGEPHGYNEFIATVDAIVIGRKTFETVLAMDPWPYGDKRVVVLSSQPIDFSTVRGGKVEQMSGSPEDIVAKLSATGERFLRAGLIQHITITRVPVLIGQGIPLFASLPHDIPLRHIATHSYPTGLVSSNYEVSNSK